MIDISKEELDAAMAFYGIPVHMGIKLLSLIRFKTLEKNEVLVEPGEECSTGYMIIRGGLIQSHNNPVSGEEKVVNFFLPSLQPFCTVWDSYFTGEKTSCKLFAFEKTLLAYAPKSDVDYHVSNDNDILNLYLKKLNETLVFENNLRVKLITSTPEQFYRYLQDHHPQVIRKVPTKYIAQFMGISREWLSKIRAQKDT